MRQRRGLRLILFPQTVPKTLGSVSLSASGSFLSEAGPFPSAAPKTIPNRAISKRDQWGSIATSTVTMHPYWTKTEFRSRPTPVGAGITARSEGDALELFELAFGSSCIVMTVEPISDIGTLDQNHVVPNMGNWFQHRIVCFSTLGGVSDEAF